MENQKQKPSLKTWSLVSAIIITVFFVAVLLIWQNNEMKELRQDMALSQRQISTTVESIQNGEVKKAETEGLEIEVEKKDPLAEWESMEILEYEFSYPQWWEIREIEETKNFAIIDFYDQNENRVGLLRCPIPEAEFDRMVYEKTNRFFQKDDDLHGAQLWSGRPDLTEYPEFYGTEPDEEMIVFMYKGDFAPAEDLPEDSCMLIIRNEENMAEIARNIYNSIK